MADVSHRLIGQFADNLAREIQSGRPDSGPAPVVTPSNGHVRAAAPPQAPTEGSVNALDLLKAPARRLLPTLLTGVALGVLVSRLTKGRAA